MSICSAFQTIQSSDDASRARVEWGVDYIREQDVRRSALFKVNKSDVRILNHTQNIYTLFKDPEKVSLIHYADMNEKETIFKAIMASAILHAPEKDSDYQKDLDFYESDLTLPQSRDLCKHFEIIRYVNRFAKAVVKSFMTDEINDGQFYNCQVLLHESKISSIDFFRWFSEVCGEYGDSFMIGDLITIEKKYNNYVSHNESREPELAIHDVSQNSYFSADIAGMNFKFSVHKVKGDGTCGYYSLGITRQQFNEGVKKLLDNEQKKEEIRLILNTVLGLSDDKRHANEDYIRAIDRVYKISGSMLDRWLQTEDIEIVSTLNIVSLGSDPGSYSLGKLEEVWNQKPLNLNSGLKNQRR